MLLDVMPPCDIDNEDDDDDDDDEVGCALDRCLSSHRIITSMHSFFVARGGAGYGCCGKRKFLKLQHGMRGGCTIAFLMCAMS